MGDHFSSKGDPWTAKDIREYNARHNPDEIDDEFGPVIIGEPDSLAFMKKNSCPDCSALAKRMAVAEPVIKQAEEVLSQIQNWIYTASMPSLIRERRKQLYLYITGMEDQIDRIVPKLQAFLTHQPSEFIVVSRKDLGIVLNKAMMDGNKKEWAAWDRLKDAIGEGKGVRK